MLGNRFRYDAQACWHDVYHALIGAENLICITGWAVWDKLQLFRGSDLNIDNRYGGSHIFLNKNKINLIMDLPQDSGRDSDREGEPGRAG